MALEYEIVDDVPILSLEGELLSGTNAYQKLEDFYAELKESFEEPWYVLLNMQNLENINELGVGILVRGHCMINDSGGKLGLYAANKRVQHFLDRTKLNTILACYATEEEAITALNELRIKKRDSKITTSFTNTFDAYGYFK